MDMSITPITMYGADWCGDCRRAKAWFEDNGYAYDYVDLVANPDETARVLERNDGTQQIPVIVFSDDSHLVEPSNDELATKMASLAQPAEMSSTEPESIVVAEDVDASRFELKRNGEVLSFATYRAHDANLIVPHVETAPQHQGNGYAAQLMEGLLATIRSSGRTITPLCPFAASHIRSNPQHRDLVGS